MIVQALSILSAILLAIRAGDTNRLDYRLVVRLAYENGPVVLDHVLTNYASEDIGILSSSIRERSIFSMARQMDSVKPKSRMQRDLCNSIIRVGIESEGTFLLRSRQQMLLRREYLDDQWVFESTKECCFDGCAWIRATKPDSSPFAVALSRSVNVRVIPNNERSRQELYAALEAEATGSILNHVSYASLSQMLARCRYATFRPIIKTMLAAQPAGLYELNTHDARSDVNLDCLVQAVYNCSPTPADAWDYITEDVFQGGSISVLPFLRYWDRKNAVLAVVVERVLGAGSSVWPGLGNVTAPLTGYTNSDPPPRHLLVAVVRSDLVALCTHKNGLVRTATAAYYFPNDSERISRSLRNDLEPAIGLTNEKAYVDLLDALASPSFRKRELAESSLVSYGYRGLDLLERRIRVEKDAEAVTRLERVRSAIYKSPVAPVLFEIVDSSRELSPACKRLLFTILDKSSLPTSFKEYARAKLVAGSR